MLAGTRSKRSELCRVNSSKPTGLNGMAPTAENQGGGMSIDTVINSLSIPAEQKGAIHALAELIETAYPEQFPQQQGPRHSSSNNLSPHWQHTVIVILLRPCSQMGINHCLIASHQPCGSSLRPRASSLPGSQTWV